MNMEFLLVVYICFLVVFLVGLFVIRNLRIDRNDCQRRLSDAIIKILDMESKLKSEETRRGQMLEKFVPFVKDLPDPDTYHYLGQPIDYVSFGAEDITFMEVKTGKARLSKEQRRIKKQIEAGKVKFETFRMKE